MNKLTQKDEQAIKLLAEVMAYDKKDREKLEIILKKLWK